MAIRFVLPLIFWVLIYQPVFSAIWDSNGCDSDSNTACMTAHPGRSIQSFHDDANTHDGDTITVPAGTFVWNTGISISQGVTISGSTTVTNAGLGNATADDQTIITDNKV